MSLTKKTHGKSKRSPVFWDRVLVYVFGIFLTLTLISSIYQKYGEYAFITAFIVGTVFGAVFTYFTQFGYYVIEPALAGSIIAVFALSGIVIFTLVATWTAVWSHNRAYIRR